jgi:hypothetical protein
VLAGGDLLDPLDPPGAVPNPDPVTGSVGHRDLQAPRGEPAWPKHSDSAGSAKT